MTTNLNNSMKYFIQETNISQNDYNKLISCSTKEYGEYVLHTYKPKLIKRNQIEDKLFIDNPFLVSILPRACTYVIHNNLLITKLEGCCKFTGFSNLDEDPEDDNEINGIKNDHLFDYSIIESWNNNKELEIIMTEKANGKFAICKIYNNLVICGSKNYHILFEINDIDNAIKTNRHNKIMYYILVDIKNTLDKLLNITEKFNQGYSLVGELCDGQHFVSGDNTISWFGLFKNGIPLETMEALNYLNANGIKTVNYSKIFDSSNQNTLMSVFDSARCLPGEGYVLRCRNTSTNKIILVKVKAIGYIVKRFFRQVLLKGYKNIFNITKRFIDAHDYHQLNTSASIRITNLLIKFGMWMMSKYYPVSILGHVEIKSVKGQIENGFNKYWEEFLLETNTDNFLITEEDFGPFDKNEYLSNIKLYENRTYDNLPTVVFLQGLQGTGKSTIANHVCSKLENSIYIEQDMFWGDSVSCQGALYHHIANNNGPKYIILSRCNINEKQYGRYLDLCHELPCKVIFISPDKMNEIDVLLSFQGIVNRSQHGDSLMVGRHELPIDEVVGFVLDNYKNYQLHPLSHTIKIRNENVELLNEAKEIIKSSNVFTFVQNNFDRIKSLRLTLDEITNNIIRIINNIDPNKIIHVPNPSYIGLLVSSEDKKELDSFVNLHVNNDMGILYNHHITLEFKPSDLTKSVKPYTNAQVHISKLVIRKADNIAAYYINNILINNKKYNIQNPHITALINQDQKPVISKSFVGLSDDSVTIINYNKTIETTCYWFK